MGWLRAESRAERWGDLGPRAEPQGAAERPPRPADKACLGGQVHLGGLNLLSLLHFSEKWKLDQILTGEKGREMPLISPGHHPFCKNPYRGFLHRLLLSKKIVVVIRYDHYFPFGINLHTKTLVSNYPQRGHISEKIGQFVPPVGLGSSIFI